MHVPTITELMRLTRSELCALASRISTEMATLPEGSPDRDTALTALHNSRAALARRDFSP